MRPIDAIAETDLTDLGKPHVAAPVTTECGEPAAFASGPAHQAGPSPLSTPNAQFWDEGGFRNQADGFYE
jgi:hypothetical protein